MEGFWENLPPVNSFVFKKKQVDRKRVKLWHRKKTFFHFLNGHTGKSKHFGWNFNHSDVFPQNKKTGLFSSKKKRSGMMRKRKKN